MNKTASFLRKIRVLGFFLLVSGAASVAMGGPGGPPSGAPYSPDDVILNSTKTFQNKAAYISSFTANHLQAATMTATSIILNGVPLSTATASGYTLYPATGTNAQFPNGLGVSTLTVSNLKASSGTATLSNLSATGASVATMTVTKINGGTLSGNNGGDVTLTNPTGLSLSGQALSLATATATSTGSLKATDWATFNGKLAPTGDGSGLTGLTKSQVGLSNVQNLDQRNATNLSSGMVNPVLLASGTADSTKYLDGNKTWRVLDSTAVGLGSVTNDQQVKVSDYVQKGAILVGISTGVFAVLAPGNDGQFLATSSTSPYGVTYTFPAGLYSIYPATGTPKFPFGFSASTATFTGQINGQNIVANLLTSTSIAATTLVVTTGTFTTAIASSMTVTNLTAGSLTISSITLNALFASTGSVTLANIATTGLTASSASIRILVGTTTINNVLISSGSATLTSLAVAGFTASSASITSLTSSVGTITTLTSSSATITNAQISSGSAVLSNLSASGAVIGTMTATGMRVFSSTITTAYIPTALISTLNAPAITSTGTVSFNGSTSTYTNAFVAGTIVNQATITYHGGNNFDTATVSTLTVNNLIFTTGTVTNSTGTYSYLTSTTMVTQLLSASSATVGSLTFASITSTGTAVFNGSTTTYSNNAILKGTLTDYTTSFFYGQHQGTSNDSTIITYAGSILNGTRTDNSTTTITGRISGSRNDNSTVTYQASVFNGTAVDNTTTTYTGASTFTALTVVNANMTSINNTAVSAWRRRNLNSAMFFDQRNEGASVTVGSNTNTFGPDMFFGYNRGCVGDWTIQRKQDTPPPGSAYYIRDTIVVNDTAPSSGCEYVDTERINGHDINDLQFGTPQASTVTWSFWVRSSTFGYFGGTLEANSAAKDAFPFHFRILSANTWQKISITIPGETVGAWTGLEGVGAKLMWDHGSGTDFESSSSSWNQGIEKNHLTGDQKLVNTMGATFDYALPQFEPGSVATTFEPHPFQEEYNEVSKYYWKTYAFGTVPGTNTGNGSGSNVRNWSGQQLAAAESDFYAMFPVRMYQQSGTANVPTVTFYAPDGTSGQLKCFNTSGASANRSIAVENQGTDGIGFYQTSAVENFCQGHMTVEAILN